MTSEQKFTWGLILDIGGAVGLLLGLGLSTSVIGACLGLPLAFVSFPFLIWGSVWLYQARSQKAQEVIAGGISVGVREGIIAGAASPKPPRLCGQCGNELGSDAAFCTSCGTPAGKAPPAGAP
jgi:hypothetical protein